MRVGLYTNLLKDADLSVTTKLKNVLDAIGFETAVYGNMRKAFADCASFDERGALLPDLLITVGGDGTILRIAKWCALHDIPILGINLGKVGFLTEVEQQDLAAMAQQLKAGNYSIESRTLLQATVKGQKTFALNEFVVDRSHFAKMILLQVAINGKRVDNYYCDGFIVSTPTGSTAYSLSAGGPVISPNAHALVLTPINSHSLHSRPIVINDDEEIEITVSMRTPEAAVTADGAACGVLAGGEKFCVRKAAKTAKFVRLSDANFYDRLLGKLNTWSVTPSEGEH